MARPIKDGLEYFSLDVDMDQDDKIVLLEGDLGLAGYGALVKLLQKIYSEGYFYRFSERELLLFAQKRLNGDINLARNLVKSAVKWGLFDEKLYTLHGILTSEGIQKRYLMATRERKGITWIKEFTLIEIPEKLIARSTALIARSTELIPRETIVNRAINTQSKVKERKGKESKWEPPHNPENLNSEIEEAPDVSPEIETSDLKFEKFFIPRGVGDWECDNRHLLASRRPLKKFPDVWVSSPELLRIVEEWRRAGASVKRLAEGFAECDSRIQTYKVSGKPTHSVCIVSWMTGWVLQKELDKEKSISRARGFQAGRNDNRPKPKIFKPSGTSRTEPPAPIDPKTQELLDKITKKPKEVEVQ